MKRTLHITDESSGNAAVIECSDGDNLRRVLLQAGLGPYTSLTNVANCGGRGICATCGVHVEESVAPTHWHDWLARRFRYPRLSCQISVDQDLKVMIPKKRVWGKRLPRKP